MDSQLVYALKQSLNQVIAPGVTNLRVFVQRDGKGRVKVDLHAAVTPDLLAFIQSSGGAVIDSVPQFQSVRAWVPLSLAEALADDQSVEVRRTAAWALGEIGGTGGAPALTRALADRDATVRRQVTWALGQLDEPSPPQLVGALKDADAEVRATAAWALGEHGDADSVGGAAAALSEAARDSDHNVRRAAIWALGNAGGAAGRDALIAALQDQDPELRQAAARALGGNHASPWPRPQPRPRPRPFPPGD